MSSHRGDLALTNPLQENTSVSKKLGNSRWAPGGFEDQQISNQKMANEQAPDDKATTTAAKGFSSSRWATRPAEPIQAQHKKKTRTKQRGRKVTEKKQPNLVPDQPFLGTNNYEPSSITETITTPRQLIGPISAAEKTIHMEDAFFDPEKHKGLGSSRWANNDELSFATQTTATPRRIIGELSEDEKAVKMENPFFDPKKHKGLRSSRWANE